MVDNEEKNVATVAHTLSAIFVVIQAIIPTAVITLVDIFVMKPQKITITNLERRLYNGERYTRF